MSSYTLATYANRPARAVMPVRYDLTGYVLTLELGGGVNDTQPAPTTGTLEYVDGNIILGLSASEVDDIGDSYFTVRASTTPAPATLYWEEKPRVHEIRGTIQYTKGNTSVDNLVGPDGVVLEQKLPESVVTETKLDDRMVDTLSTETQSRQLLDSVYIRKDEYVPGQGPSEEALNSLINTSIGVHVQDPTPHPTYDDLPSLKILFENGLI